VPRKKEEEEDLTKFDLEDLYAVVEEATANMRRDGLTKEEAQKLKKAAAELARRSTNPEPRQTPQIAFASRAVERRGTGIKN